MLAGYALAQVAFIVFVWVNHAPFPLNLEAMELTILQHVRRAASRATRIPSAIGRFRPADLQSALLLPVCLPFTRVLGSSLLTLRLVSIMGMLGAGVVIYLAVRHSAGTWWGLVAAGLFAAAYRVMDTYLDNAHADSWMLFVALLGSYLVERNSSRVRTALLGVALSRDRLLVQTIWGDVCRGGYGSSSRGGMAGAEHCRAGPLPPFFGPGLYFVAGPWLLLVPSSSTTLGKCRDSGSSLVGKPPWFALCSLPSPTTGPLSPAPCSP